ncbi:helix-turn-helix domain-containing protein [Aeromicrobium flavum]|nr:helix-turn-helix domain-containing protein [Aeromicrobium flavum]
MMSVEELSAYLDVPIRTLYDWRRVGRGPCPIHVGRQLRYFVSDVLADQRELSGGANPTPG